MLFRSDGACLVAKDCLGPSSTVALSINPIASYAFTIGAKNGTPRKSSPAAAPAFAIKTKGDEVFVNTGYHFFNQFNYVYDYVNGQVGYADQSSYVYNLADPLVGATNQVSVPGPLPVAGAAFAYRWSRRLRSSQRRGRRKTLT